MADTQPQQIVLPERLVGSVDLGRTIRELQALDESLRQSDLRKPGEPTQLARSSATLEELAKLNNVQLTDATQRQQLETVLDAFKKHAPRIHVSLATEPSANFTRKILIWLRTNVHPLILLEVGLQPTLAAGCVIRTNNKMFDMSLRHRFAEKRQFLADKIGEIGAIPDAPGPVAVAQPVVATAVPEAAVPAPTPTPQPVTQAAPTPVVTTQEVTP